MPSLDDLIAMGQEVLEEFDNSTAGGTAGVDAAIVKYARSTYSPATGKFLAEVQFTYSLPKYTRTRSTVYPVGEQGAGSTRRVEEFFVTVAIADLEALTPAWPSGVLPDETCAFVVTVGEESKVYPIVSCERVLKESLFRMKVRRDLGPTTTA